MKINDDQMLLQAGAAGDIYHQLSLDLFDNLIAQLKKRGVANLEATPYIWQLEKLNDMHLLNDDNVRLIAERSGVAETALRNVIEREGFKVYQDTREQLARDMGKAASAYNGVQEALAAYASQTFREVNNLINTTLPASVQAVYKGIVEQTVASVVTGLKSPQQALNETVMKWFDKGFYGFTDKAGRQWRADVYARNVITSTTYRVYNEMRTQASEEMGVDTYYYSKKVAARPACADIQGRIVTKGDAFTEKGVQVLSLLDHGYGSAGGCLGINCRHTLTPFIIGVNKLPDVPDHLKNVTPAQAIDNGKKQAQQRAFEREIRKAKERLNVAKQLDYAEAIDKYGAKVKKLQGGLNQLLKDNQFLNRDTLRERMIKSRQNDKILAELVEKRMIQESKRSVRSGALNKYASEISKFAPIDKSEKSAKNMYVEFAQRNPKMCAARLAEASGFSQAEGNQIFEHIFRNKHLFDDGTIGMFDPDIDMARSFSRILNGQKLEEHDIMMLRHELYESSLMKANPYLPYELAHKMANEKYNYHDVLEKYKARRNSDD